MGKSIAARLEALEAAAWAALPAADRAEARIARGETYEALTDEELEAFIGEHAAYLRAMPDALIDAILAHPPRDDNPLSTLRAAYADGPERFTAALAELEALIAEGQRDKLS